jgi:transaldolase/glucose-6-phosphate isomerase
MTTTTPKTDTAVNKLAALRDHGQSVWLDFIRRSLITSGGLKKLVDEDALGGVTSNPAIFEKAIAGSDDYKDAIQEASKDPHLTPKRLFEILAIKDIQDAADVLRPVYDKTKALDGYVSLEVAPDLAHNTEGTLAEARRLWKEVNRPNVMIKIPATPAGVPAIQQALTEGININVTLLFSKEAYEGVARAFVDGIEARAKAGQPVDKVASVASFFVSRIDSLVDTWLAEKAKTASADDKAKIEALMGKVAIANAKIAYQSYKQIFSGSRWDALKAKNAQVQRVLWASTGTKNPRYSDCLYVDELIGPETVNTMPPDTLNAFRDHGKLRKSLEEDVDGAKKVLADLEKYGVSLKKATDELLVDAVNKFVEPFEKLLKAVERRAREANKPRINQQTYKLPAALQTAVTEKLKAWDADGGTRGLFAGDAKLWSGQDEANWIGWIGVVEQQCSDPGPRQQMREEAKKAGYTHALLLGMGGSSLCPEVWKETFGRIPGSPELHVLDSTDPAQVAAFEKKVDLKKTIFIVSSKSGSTLEPNIFKAYFFDKAKQALGADAAKHFVAVTDPGSNLEKEAKADGFGHIFPGLKTIGGRYSALSNFGIVPAAIMGLPFEQLLDEADRMLHACAPGVPADENPGLTLGTILGVAATQGRDKITIIASPGIYDLGAWLEQLIAESTGKEGKGIIPVDRESVGAPSVYGNDRVFAYLRLSDAPDAKQDAAVAELEKAGQPVVRIEVATKNDLAEEFVRWEIATAIAGSVIKINPFNQPDVEASKIATKAITAEYEKTGALPAESPIFEGDGVKLFTDPKNADELKKAVGGSASLNAYIKAHLDRVKAGDYLGLLAYVEMTPAHEQLLQKGRHAVRDKKKIATCLGFGPRFLHSTGQGYKGGPNSGVFLQVTCDDAKDLPVPGSKYTFGVVKAAQARGDFAVLAERGRRALRVHLGADVAKGLATLNAAIEKALS